MASAATVAVDAARSPLRTTEVDEVHGITSKITANDEEHTGLTDEDDEDEDITTHSRSRKPQRPAAEDAEDEGGDADLFGDDDEDEPAKPARYIDDEELDSGDDEGRTDREHAEEPEMVAEERTVQDVVLPRLSIPDPSDGEMYLLKVPKFLSIDAKAFSEESFQPPAADHHAKEPSKTFSAYNTATTTIRWRRSPSKPSEMQSNARINRWSDGSLTIQFASNPTVQYEINGNALAPPQRNPIIPTPTSVHTNKDRGGREGIDNASERFDASKHAFTYMAAPMPSRGLLRITNVLTTGLTVSPPADFIDEAIVNLQSDLAAAERARNLTASGNIELVAITEDPELAKKRAEQAEREKARARKKQEAQMERERERSNRALGRSGLSTSRYGGGLSAGMLEDDDGLTTTRGRPAKPKAPRRRRANSEYSSEEDYGRRAFQVSKEDDYDVEDDFVAGSDEEEEVVDDDEDEDDGIIEEGRSRREPTPKRGRATADEDEDEDAEGEVDNAPTGERKRRRVVVADDDDDE